MPYDGLVMRDEIQRAIEDMIHYSWWPHLASTATITSIADTEHELVSLTELVHALEGELKHMAVTLDELTAHIKTSTEDTALLITSLPAYFEAVNALINEVKAKVADTPLDFTEQVKAIDQADADVKAAIAQLSASKELFPAPAASVAPPVVEPPVVVPPVEPPVVAPPVEPATHPAPDFPGSGAPIAPASVTVANEDGTTTVTTAEGFVTTMNQNGAIIPNP